MPKPPLVIGHSQRASWVVGAAAWLVGGCTDLPVIEADVCGNAVVEADEDCDTFASLGRACRAPGLVDACHLDCSEQSDGTHQACPEGFGCNLDGACRATVGDYAFSGTFEAGAVAALQGGDFDGDGRWEVLSTEPLDATLRSRFRLHYFDIQGRQAEARPFPKVAASPLFQDLDGDGLSDLLFSDFRLGLLRGRADRSWVPDTFTTYRLPKTGLHVIGIHDGIVQAVSPFATLTRIDGVAGIYVADVESFRLKLLAELGGDITEIAGRPAAGNLVEGEDSPCLEVVVGLRGASSFSMFELCRPRRAEDAPFAEHPAAMPFWLEQAREQVVTLPPGVTLDGHAPLVADIDSDGHLDVLVGANSRPYLVRGDGQRLLEGAEPYALPFAGTEYLNREIPMPLAAGDFTGDHHVDFVLPKALVSSQSVSGSGALSYIASQVNRAEPWTVAQIADLNRNGLPDVVAASDSGVGVAFFSGTLGPFQIPSRLPSNEPVRDLAVGDFDGDQVGDVAFIEQASADGHDDVLKLAFGNAAIPPSEPLQGGRLRNARTIVSYAQAGFGHLLATSSEGRGAGLTLLDDGIDRLPFAPCALVNFAYDRSIANYASIAFSVGAFTKPGGKDAMALASADRAQDWSLWLVPGITAAATPVLLEGGLPEGASPVTVNAAGQRFSATSTAADVDGDQVDESIWVLPALQGEGCAIASFGADLGERRLLSRGLLTLDAPCLDALLVARDLDGDELVDLVLLTDRRREPQQLLVLWNDGRGGYALGNATPLASPDGGLIRDFKLTGDEQWPLVFVTGSGLFATRRRAASREFAAPLLLRQVDDASALAIADVNGDGPADLIVADATGVSVLLAQLEH